MENKKNAPLRIDDDELEQVAGGFGEGGVIASGSFASNTGTYLNIVAEWIVLADMYGGNTLQVDVSALSSTLQSGPTPVELNVNGMIYAASSASVSYGERSVAAHHLASFSVPNVMGMLNVTAVWRFNGVYSGVPVSEVRASGVIIL